MKKVLADSFGTNDGNFASGFCNWPRYCGASGILSCSFTDNNRCVC